MHRTLASILAFLLAALVGSAGVLASPAAAPRATDANTLVVGAAFDIKSLDPARGFEQITSMVHKATYDTLVTLDEKDISKIVPDLAESWEVSPDAKTFTFHLRQNVKFHSGNPMTSADVKWSYERAMGIKGNPSFLLDGIASVDTPDDYTVVIRKTDPDPSFIAKSIFGVFAVLDSKTVMAHGGTSGPDAKDTDKAEDWLNQNSAGTGPFILKKWTPETEVEVEKFSDYWGGSVPFDRVIYRNIPEPATQKLTLEAGDIDIATEVSPDQVPALKGNPDVQVVEGVGTDIFFLLMNENPDLSGGTMSNPKVQLAVRYALDYDGIRKLVGGPAVTPPSMLPVGFLGAYPPDKAFTRDLDKAKALLAEAGYPNGFDIQLDYPTKFARSGVSFDLVAQKIQADLTEAGIRVTLRPGELQTSLAEYRAGKQAFGFWLWGADYFDSNDYLAFLPEGIVGKRANWTNANADSTIKQLRDQIAVEVDNAKRAQLWQQVQDYLQQNGPYAPLLQPGAYVALRANVQNYVYNPAWRVNPLILSKT